MKFLSKVVGLFFIVFAFAFYQAEPLQKRHHRGPHKSHYRAYHRPKYKRVVYHRAPRHYYKKQYYRPVKHRYYLQKRYKHHRVYRSRPVIVIHR